MSFKRKINTAFRIWRVSGLPGIRRRIAWNRFREFEGRSYVKWLKRHGALSEKEVSEIACQIKNFDRLPLISVILPVYNIDEKWLRLCIESVRQQLYTNWELCIADDHSPSPHVRRVLEEYAASDPRIRVVFRPENGHISAASNSALELATGEFAVLLDHDDELSPDALFCVAAEIIRHPDVAMIYSDEDMIGEDGVRFAGKFKPDFSRDLLHSLNLVTHLSAYRTDILKSIGGFRTGYEGSQDFDLALRVTELIGDDRIRHIPRILYHWRAVAGSVASDVNAKPYAHERAREALRSHFERKDVAAIVEEADWNLHRVRYALPADAPSATVFLFGDNAATVVDRYVAKTSYPNATYVPVPEDEAASASKALSSRARRINTGAFRAKSDVLVFANGAFLPADENWLEELVRFVIQPDIGAVGGKLLARDETVADGGLIIGGRECVSVACGRFPKEAPGNVLRNIMNGNFSAVSASCMAIRREVFEKAGGFDAERFPEALFDADLCLRLWRHGLRVVYTPYVVLKTAAGSAIRAVPADDEIAAFRERWGDVLDNDPFCNPNLSYEDGTFAIKL